MAPRRYKVTADYVTVKTTALDGPQIVGLYRGAHIPVDVPQETIDHLLSVGMIRDVTPVSVPAAAATGTETGMVADDSAGATPGVAGEQSSGDVEQRRADAKAKLDAAGGTPTKRHGQQVWAEYAVVKGYDRTQAEAATKDELIDLFGSG